MQRRVLLASFVCLFLFLAPYSRASFFYFTLKLHSKQMIIIIMRNKAKESSSKKIKTKQREKGILEDFPC